MCFTGTAYYGDGQEVEDGKKSLEEQDIYIYNFQNSDKKAPNNVKGKKSEPEV